MRPLARLSPRRRALVAGAAVLVVLAGTAAVVGFVARRGAPAGFPAQSRPGAVILVPGYGGSQASLSVLAARIAATGRQATVLTLPGDATGDLAEQADALDAAVGRAVGAGAPSVDLVGYSAGGVVVRLWLDRHDGSHRARRIVTVGSPLNGTRLAAAGSAFAPDVCPTACQQLVPGSALLRQLAGERVPSQLPWLSMWTEDDETVTPPDSARLAGAVNVDLQDICADARISHGGLPTDPLVIGLVLGAIGPGRPAAPRPSDCAALRAAG